MASAPILDIFSLPSLRLAFSVVWDLDADGKILSQWAGRSVICSCAKLAYPMVQAMIEGRFQRETCKAVLFGFNTWDEVRGVCEEDCL